MNLRPTCNSLGRRAARRSPPAFSSGNVATVASRSRTRGAQTHGAQPVVPVCSPHATSLLPPHRRNPNPLTPSRSSPDDAVATEQPDASEYEQGAAGLMALMEALPELTEPEQPGPEGQGGQGSGTPALALLLDTTPALAEVEPAVLRDALTSLAAALGVSLPRAARLAARVPSLWELPYEETGSKVAGMGAALGVGTEAALELYCAQPGIWAVSQPSIIKDRLETLATRLGLPLPSLVSLVARQPILWVLPPSHVASSASEIAGRLGLSEAEAAELLVRCPPVAALEPRLLKLSVQGVCATTGASPASLLRLLSRSLGLVALPTEQLAGALEALAADLRVGPQEVVELLTTQPTLLCAQYNTIQAALEVLESTLDLDRPAALRLLASQPYLMYDTSADTVSARVEGLRTTFRLPSLAAARSLAAEVPVLLAVTAATVRSAAAALAAGLGADVDQVLELAKSDPGEFIMVTVQDSLLEAWAGRLELPPQAVRAMLAEQPALLELTPTTVKARLESLGALFGCPLPLAVQLALKHAALGAVPPNATITRAKNVSMALKVSMQSAASIVAKEPAFLAVLATRSSELAGGPVPEEVAEVGAAYEFYTAEWLQRQAKEAHPGKVTSFAKLDS